VVDLERLLTVPEPAWPAVQSWIGAAKVPVEVLPCDPEARVEALQEVGITIGSALGAVVYESGGLLVDHGWIRVRGSGHERLPRRVAADRSWLLIAEDIVGGFFALHPPEGGVMYLAPDTLEWESMESKYSAWLRWMMGGSTAKFYGAYRGPGWERQAAALRPDQTYMILPPPWTKGPEFALRSWVPTPASELYGLTLSFSDQLRNPPSAGV